MALDRPCGWVEITQYPPKVNEEKTRATGCPAEGRRAGTVRAFLKDAPIRIQRWTVPIYIGSLTSKFPGKRHRPPSCTRR